MKTDTSSRPLLRTPAGIITAVSILGIIAYVAWIFSFSYTQQRDALVSGIGLVLLNMLAGIFGVYIISQRGFSRTLRFAWFLISVGSWCYVIARGLRTYYGVVLGIDPFPSPADYFYLLYYPLTLGGMLTLLSVFVPRQERTILWLDLAIVLTFFGMVLWYYFLASPLFSVNQKPGEYIALVYPVGDFLILAVVIALMQRDLTKVARWILGFFILAMVLAAIGDTSFAFFEVQGQYYDMAYLNVPWMCSIVAQMLATAQLIASGPGMQKDSPIKVKPLDQRLRLALPYLAIVVGLGLLTWIIYNSRGADNRLLGMLYGAIGLVLFVLWRQYEVSEENVRLYQRVQRIAWTDSLTGVYNRHFFNEMLPREMERASRYGNQLSVLLLDIDNFKKYNDTYGHLKGDTVLKTIARLFTTQLRISDTIARFGGDEFVIILPETSRRRAVSIADRIRNAVDEQSFGNVKLSVSIGVSSFHPGLTPEQFLDGADQDMYRRKNQARNASQPAEAPESIDSVINAFRQDSSVRRE